MASSSQNMSEKQCENLKNILRNSCFVRFTSSLKSRAVVELKDDVPKDDFLYGQWMTVILLSGPSMQSVLKLHFFSEDAKEFAALAMGIEKRDVQNNMMIDYMKELTNLFAGEIKSQLFDNDILVGISLPLVTRGFDEVLFSDQSSESLTRDFWSMRSGNSRVTITSEAEVFQPQIFDNTSFTEMNEEDEGEVDFL